LEAKLPQALTFIGIAWVNTGAVSASISVAGEYRVCNTVQKRDKLGVCVSDKTHTQEVHVER
jgi:hypothetical protein